MHLMNWFFDSSGSTGKLALGAVVAGVIAIIVALEINDRSKRDK